MIASTLLKLWRTQKASNDESAREGLARRQSDNDISTVHDPKIIGTLRGNKIETLLLNEQLNRHSCAALCEPLHVGERDMCADLFVSVFTNWAE